MNLLAKALVSAVLAGGLALACGGVVLLVQRETGTRARATVTGCRVSGSGRYERTDCTGTWVVGGTLVGGSGHVVVGTIDGSEASDVGKTIDVTVSGDHARSRSPVLPIVLLGLGLVVLAGGVVLVRTARRAARRAAGQLPRPAVDP
jgi:hypothetical protein